jgi:predicted transcriptional regulator
MRTACQRAVTTRLPEALQAKLEYLSEHSPESIHDIALAAVSSVEKRLREMNIKV